MTEPSDDVDVVFDAVWRAYHRRMLQLAVRMLSDVGEAEDAVQEAFSRLARTDLATIEEPEGWLVVVTSRLCLDRLRARRRRPIEPLDPGSWSHRPSSPDPADHLALVDSVTLSMHIVLERLTPAERTAFVLHDVFHLPYSEIGTIVGRNATACRQLASRARRLVRAAAPGRRLPVEDDMQRTVAERFITACSDGDVTGLVAVLDPDVDGTSDVTGDVTVGAERVAAGILRHLGPPSPTLLHVPLDDAVGIIAIRHRRVQALVVLTIEQGLIVHIEAHASAATCAAAGVALGLTTRTR